jgi:hypothetical protein
VRLAAVPGVVPVSLGTVDATAAELLDVLYRVRGRDAARDPGLAIAASQTAELAHRHGAGLVAVVEHPSADPALLVAWVMPVDRRLDATTAVELGNHLADAGGPDIREVSRTSTAAGYPAVIVERISMTGAQLQVVVADTARPRVAVFTLHSPGGRGWLDVAAVTGRFVTGMRFDGPPGTRAESDRPLSGTRARSARR